MTPKFGTYPLKVVRYEIPKPSACLATLFYCKFWAMFHVFHLAWSTCGATKMFDAGWRKLLWKIECGSTLSNNFGFARSSQTHNLKYNKFAHAVRQVESFCISYFPALGKMTHILKLFPWESLPTSHPPLTLAFSSCALRSLVVPPCLSTNYFGTKIHKTVHNWLLL